MPKDKYCGFDELRRYEDAEDYGFVIADRDSDVLILAPHGGDIELITSDIARNIAGQDYGLYIFEGRKTHCNYATLHITSTRFDEPQCLRMVTQARIVVAIHGCRGQEEIVYLGGLHDVLRDQIAERLNHADYDAHAHGHQYPGRNPRNVCNLGVTGAGVQIELTRGLRDALDVQAFAAVVRGVLEEA